jgi:deoxyribodipyrimidine photo-lyase
MSTALVWNRLYDPAVIARDRQIKASLRAEGISCRSFNSALLFEPWTLQTRDGGPYKVFSAFWRACQRAAPNPRPPVEAPANLPPVPVPDLATASLDQLGLLPKTPGYEGLDSDWNPGEAGALAQLRCFLEDGMEGYVVARDLPGPTGTSRLSPYLHFGEIGPSQVHRVLSSATGSLDGHPGASGPQAFWRELGWREFAHHLLYHFPHSTERPLDRRFEHLPWRERTAGLALWQRGQTGIPLVDAGMRELWHSGYMHNRVRMVVASLLTKNLGVHWLQGARWFWDTLVDADLANNSLGWQWTAGCGADAAPYFRVFNPVRQGERFDADGTYVRRWLPALRLLPARWIHQPWAAPADVLADAGLKLGSDYPLPIVDLAASRARPGRLECDQRIRLA